jgi:tripeptide aminopeptidase
MIDSRLKQIFLEVIKIEGLSGQEKQVSEYIVNFLQNLGLNPKIDKSSLKTKSNTGNVMCKIGNGGDFVLCSHMDTARSTKKVRPKVRKDRITSDGNTVLGVDNRAGIAVLLFTVEKLLKEKTDVKDFTVAFTTCEETSLGGSKNLKLSKKIKKVFVFDSYQAPGNYINKSFGAATFTINILGKAAHSGVAPEQGINALQIAAAALNKISHGRQKDGTTINFGLIEGGCGTNVVPDKIKIVGEVRSNTIVKVERYISMISKLFTYESAKLKGNIKFDWIWDFKPYQIPMDSQIIKQINKAITDADLKPLKSISKGGSDANSFNENGIQAINLGIGAQNPHSNDEFILLNDLQNAYRIAHELVKAK